MRKKVRKEVRRREKHPEIKAIFTRVVDKRWQLYETSQLDSKVNEHLGKFSILQVHSLFLLVVVFNKENGIRGYTRCISIIFFEKKIWVYQHAD